MILLSVCANCLPPASAGLVLDGALALLTVGGLPVGAAAEERLISISQTATDHDRADECGCDHHRAAAAARLFDFVVLTVFVGVTLFEFTAGWLGKAHLVVAVRIGVVIALMLP